MMDNLLAALSIEGWCNDHTWAILSRVLPEGATICGAPGRWGPSKSRARSTKKQRPPSTSRRNIVPHSSIFIICWCRISGMGVYEELKPPKRRSLVALGSSSLDRTYEELKLI